MPAAANARLYRFGIYEADLRSGELRKNGARLKLQEQPFQVLAILLQRRGEVVTRDELRQRLWPAVTLCLVASGFARSSILATRNCGQRISMAGARSPS